MPRSAAADRLGVTRLSVRSLLRRGRLRTCSSCSRQGVTRESVEAEERWPSTVAGPRWFRRKAGDLLLAIFWEGIVHSVGAVVGAIIDGL